MHLRCGRSYRQYANELVHAGDAVYLAGIDGALAMDG